MAKEASERQYFQYFRPLTSLNAQHATELKNILENQSGNIAFEVNNKRAILYSEAPEEVGDEEKALMKKAIAAEKELIAKYNILLATAELPNSVKNIVNRQLEVSQKAYSFLQNLQ